MKKLEQYQGSILGLAIGDALGYPCEFRTRSQILEAFPPSGVRDFVGLHDDRWPKYPIIIGSGEMPPGTFSDDTQMTLAIAEGLIQGKGDFELSMESIARHFVEWSRSPDNNRSPGGTCMTGCENLSKGIPWRESGVSNSKGCGSAMRVAPIGLVFAEDLDRLAHYAAASSLMTHGHPAGIDGAIAAALLVALALSNASLEEMFESVNRYCHSDDFHRLWNTMPDYFDLSPEEVLIEGVLGESWIAEEAVASAFYCYQRSPGSFEDVVLTASNTDGDSDSIACIAGSISGAALGISGIPQGFLNRVESRDHLFELSTRLLSLKESQVVF